MKFALPKFDLLFQSTEILEILILSVSTTSARLKNMKNHFFTLPLNFSGNLSALLQSFYPIYLFYCPSSTFSLITSFLCLKSHQWAPYPLRQRLANYSLRAKPCLPVFVKAVSLEHKHAPLFMYGRWSLYGHFSTAITMLKSCYRDHVALMTYLLCSPLQKTLHQPFSYRTFPNLFA